MLIRQYIPFALAVLAIVCAFAYEGGVPLVPVAIILVVGEILIAFQLEDHRLANFLANLTSAFRAHGHLHHK